MSSAAIRQSSETLPQQSFEETFIAHEQILGMAGVSDPCYDIMHEYQKDLGDTCRKICNEYGKVWRKKEG